MLPAVFVRDEFLSREQCRSIRLAMGIGEQSPAEIYDGQFVVDERMRRSIDVGIDETTVISMEAALARIRPELSRFFGVPLSSNEGAGFLRYHTGGFYRPHRDCIEAPESPYARRVSVIVFLTDARSTAHGELEDGECAGGALRVCSDDGAESVDVYPRAGTLVAFKAQTVHEVRCVTAGVRDVVVDWCY